MNKTQRIEIHTPEGEFTASLWITLAPTVQGQQGREGLVGFTLMRSYPDFEPLVDSLILTGDGKRYKLVEIEGLTLLCRNLSREEEDVIDHPGESD